MLAVETSSCCSYTSTVRYGGGRGSLEARSLNVPSLIFLSSSVIVVVPVTVSFTIFIVRKRIRSAGLTISTAVVVSVVAEVVVVLVAVQPARTSTRNNNRFMGTRKNSAGGKTF